MTSKQLEQYQAQLEDERVPILEVGEWLDPFRPRKLYRFMRFGQHWKENVFEGKFYLASASNINDPFDCLAYVNHEEYAKHAAETVINMFPYINKKVITDISRETIDDELERLLYSMKGKIRIASLTETPISPLMWAHYADSHKGFCIEYDLSKLHPGFRQSVFPVVYSDKRYDATYGLITRNRNILMNPLLYKSTHWKYEKEWRMIAFEQQFSDYEYYADFRCAISAIYLGVESIHAHEEKVHEIQDHYKANRLPVYKVEIDNRSFKLIPTLMKD